MQMILPTWLLFFRDSTTSYQTSISYLNIADTLIAAFLDKHSSEKDLKEKLITIKGDLSVSYIYAGKPDSAILVANQLKTIKGGEGIADVCLIRAYLLSNRYEDALKLYKGKANKPVRGELSLTYKEFLIARLTKMKAKNITSQSTERFLAYLEKNTM